MELVEWNIDIATITETKKKVKGSKNLKQYINLYRIQKSEQAKSSVSEVSKIIIKVTFNINHTINIIVYALVLQK